MYPEEGSVLQHTRSRDGQARPTLLTLWAEYQCIGVLKNHKTHTSGSPWALRVALQAGDESDELYQVWLACTCQQLGFSVTSKAMGQYSTTDTYALQPWHQSCSWTACKQHVSHKAPWRSVLQDGETSLGNGNSLHTIHSSSCCNRIIFWCMSLSINAHLFGGSLQSNLTPF